MNDFDQKAVWEIAVSSFIVAVTAYYFVPGANNLTTALWMALTNVLVDAAAVIIVGYFLP